MRKQEALKSDTITFDEFIDLITNNRGEDIKKQIRVIEFKSKQKKNIKIV
ncbi:hypothetical protein J4437_01245 [Candidatus Woesearchaeota archaeon]|nr:hypothetical protein [Candidatus Woesearchaeota archaeon]